MKTASAHVRRLAFFSLLAFAATDIAAYSQNPAALTSMTNRNPSASCGGCHGAVNATTVTITGASALNAGQSSTYTITASKSAVGNVRMGVAVAASDAGTPLTVTPGQPTVLQGNEIIHSTGVSALPVSNGTSAAYGVTYTMPAGAAAGSTHTIYAVAALAFQGWNHATNFVVTTRPAATTGLTLTNATASTIDLSWTGGGPQYRVVYKTGAVVPANETDGTTIDVGAVSSTTVTGLTASTQYSFAVFSKATGVSVFASSGSTGTASTIAVVVATRYVNAGTGVNTGVCSSPGSPCKTITYAMNQAVAGNPGDLVSVAPGTYNLALGEVFPITLNSGVQLVATGNPSNTIIDANGPAVTVNGGILAISGNASSATRVEGFTIMNGLVTPGQGGSGLGGAMYISGGGANTVTVIRNVFLNNTARGYSADGTLGQTGGLAWGGAIAVFGTAAEITNNVFTGNSARGGNGLSHFGTPLTGNENGGSAQGGAVYFAGSGKVFNNTFVNNNAVGGNGGGSSTGTGNSGAGIGGAIYENGSPAPEITNNIFYGNGATNGSGSGMGTSFAGALSASIAVITKNLFFANEANGAPSMGDNQGSGAVLADPVFHTLAVYKLRNSSPAKGAGTATGAPTVDYDNVTRPNPPSMGAYEASFLTQAISFGAAPTIAVGGTGSVSATGGASGNPVTFTSQTTGVCTVSGATVTGVSAGSCTIAANQAASTDYSAAPQVTQSFSISATSFTLTVSRDGTGSGTVTSSPVGISCASTCAASFNAGTGVTLSAVAAAGSTFAGWSGGGCSGTGGCTVTMNAATAVTATFNVSTAPTVFNVVISGAQEVPPNAVGASGSGTATVDTVANTITYSFSVTGLSGGLTGVHFHGPAARGVDAGVKIDLGAAPFSGTVNYSEADQADILNGLWYVNYHTAAFPGGEIRGQLDNLGGPSTFALTVSKGGAGTGTVTSSPAGIDCGSTCASNFGSGSTVTLSATATAGSTFAGWSGGGCSGTGTCAVTLSAAASVTATFNAPSTFVLTVTKAGTGTGTVTSSPAGITCGATCTGNFNSGATITLTAAADVGSAFGGWSGGGCSGTGTCLVTLTSATTVTATFANPPRLANIATRMQVLTGDNVLIGGFIIGGSTAKTVVVRARGPSLTALGVPGALANPVLNLFSGQTVIASNDDFGSAANAAQLQASGFAPSNPLESAILTTLSPGPYTAIVSGAGGGTGVGIIEVFEVDALTVPLINIATRGQVLTGDNVMIGGFIIQGNGPQTVVVRARGPSLTALGVPGALANPVLNLFSGQTVIASNDDWQTAANAATLQSSGFAPSNVQESAILITLNPGAYTAIVSGAGGTTGVGIVEVFAVP